MEKDLDLFRKNFKLERPELLSPLALAFVGDAVYEVFTRILVADMQINPKRLHRKNIELVSAKSQARIMTFLEERLSPDEDRIFKRGRNQKPHTVPKNTDVTTYRISTGFEALIGYLYLTYQDERLEEIFEIIKENLHES
ncbi:ribonuclease III [Peptoniphilus sp. GNH]|nr:RNase3 domain protein [Clostridiales bacterium KA00134]UHR02297.1 ribonuclease III [Peptoniphilus sp. GNH]